MQFPQVTIMGAGNILFRDEGFGVHVIKNLELRCSFPSNVSIIDGGVLGLNLLGVLAEADHLIVVDAVKLKSSAGTLHRLENEDIPKRMRHKNSLHQVDLIETLTLCQALDKVPDTVVIGIEPEDIQSLCLELSPKVASQIDKAIEAVLKELDRLQIPFENKGNDHVPCYTF